MFTFLAKCGVFLCTKTLISVYSHLFSLFTFLSGALIAVAIDSTVQVGALADKAVARDLNHIVFLSQVSFLDKLPFCNVLNDATETQRSDAEFLM